MITYRNLILVGTSHISPESIRLVREVIKEKKPGFVGVELDKGRFHALFEKRKEETCSYATFTKLGFSGFLFALFGSWIEKRLGRIVGTKPGAEMKAAIHEAALVHAKIILLDQDIVLTIRKLFRELTFQEKMRFVGDVLKGLLGFGERIPFDLRKTPKEEEIEHMMNSIQKRYPSFYRVLIDERNSIMARKLCIQMEKHPESTIVAIVGAGHEKGIYQRIIAVS